MRLDEELQIRIKIIDDIIQANIDYLSGSKDVETFINLTIREAVNQFVLETKLDDIDYASNDWVHEEETIYSLWGSLIPFLKKKYYGELVTYYQNKRKRFS